MRALTTIPAFSVSRSVSILRPRLSRAINRLRIFATRSAKRLRELRAFRPVVELRRGADELLLVAELPGLHQGDVEVVVRNDELVLRGEKRNPLPLPTIGRKRARFGRFERVVPLKAKIDARGIRTRFEDGVLLVTLPVAHPASAQVAHGRMDRLSSDAAKVDETVDESFPASDPPSWTATTASTAGTKTP
jgi:HSP20 family molecular chaperone IbpA